MRVPRVVPLFLPPVLPFSNCLEPSFCLEKSLVIWDFEIALANLSSSFLEVTELGLDRDEAVVFKDAKTPEICY